MEHEHRRNVDPKYEGKQRFLEKQKDAQLELRRAREKGGTALEEYAAKAAAAAAFDETGKWGSSAKDGWELQQTAAAAEVQMEHQREKEKRMALFGVQALTTDAKFGAYEKSLKKLPVGAVAGDVDALQAGALEQDPFSYGRVGASVSKAGAARLGQFMEDTMEARDKRSKRKTVLEEGNIDHINEKNNAFNKKLKKSFDKYTLEIRQNMERGTAV